MKKIKDFFIGKLGEKYTKIINVLSIVAVFIVFLGIIINICNNQLSIKEEFKNTPILVFTDGESYTENKIKNGSSKTIKYMTFDYDKAEHIEVSNICKVKLSNAIPESPYKHIFEVYTYDNKKYYYLNWDECLPDNPSNKECMLSLFANNTVILDYDLSDKGFYINENYKNKNIYAYKNWEDKEEINYDSCGYTKYGITMNDYVKIEAKDIYMVKCIGKTDYEMYFNISDTTKRSTMYLFEITVSDGNVYYDYIANNCLNEGSTDSDYVLAYFSFNGIVLDYN